MKLVDYFNKHKKKNTLFRFWYTYNPDGFCDYMYVSEVFEDSKGDIIGLMLSENKDHDKAEYYAWEEIKRFGLCYEDQEQ